MSDKHAGHRAVVPPVPLGVERPRWSVMIPTYNGAAYLAATLESVLQQDPGLSEMQIAVVDDCSSADDPLAIAESIGAGRVELFRQPRNVGHVHNFNTCLQRSRGVLVHVLHGDDLVRPGFYRTMQRPFVAHPEIGAAFCSYIAVDEQGRGHTASPLLRNESGILDGWLEEIAVAQRLQAPSMVVRRAVYEKLGGFDDRIRYYGEDWEMWVRIAAHFPVWYEIEPLAFYRTHRASLSGRSSLAGDNLRDLMTAIELNAELLPPDRVAALTRAARRNNARGALRRMHRAVVYGQPGFTFAQLRATLALDSSPEILARSVHLLVRWITRKVIGPRSMPNEQSTTR